MKIMKRFIIAFFLFYLTICTYANEKLVKIHKLSCLEFIDNKIPASISEHIPQTLISQSDKNNVYPTIWLSSSNNSNYVRLTVSFTPYDLFSNHNNSLIGYCIINGYKYLLNIYKLNQNLFFRKTQYPSFVIKEYDILPYIYDGPEFYFKISHNSIKYIGSGFYE